MMLSSLDDVIIAVQAVERSPARFIVNLKRIAAELGARIVVSNTGEAALISSGNREKIFKYVAIHSPGQTGAYMTFFTTQELAYLSDLAQDNGAFINPDHLVTGSSPR
jgi:hypothetical protein